MIKLINVPQWDIQEMVAVVCIFLGYSCVLLTVFFKSVRIECKLTCISTHHLSLYVARSSVDLCMLDPTYAPSIFDFLYDYVVRLSLLFYPIVTLETTG